jgi:hypothetical protein
MKQFGYESNRGDFWKRHHNRGRITKLMYYEPNDAQEDFKTIFVLFGGSYNI